MSLVELMVSLTIGLFLIAGAMSVFMAASQTGVRKTEADQALEAFRFSQFILSRALRQASSVNPASTASELVLDLIGTPDCQGGTASTNKFDLNNGALRCIVGTSAQALVENVSDIKFSYGKASTLSAEVAFVEATAVGALNWGQVRSVLVTVTAKRGTVDGLKTSFVVTLRKKALTG